VVLSRLQAGANHQGSQTNLFYTAFSGFIVHPSSRVKSQSGQFGKSFRSLVTHSKTGISSSRGSGRASCSEHSQLSSTVTKPREATKPRSHQATKPPSHEAPRSFVIPFVVSQGTWSGETAIGMTGGMEGISKTGVTQTLHVAPQQLENLYKYSGVHT
jgi:hypothetical protein